MRLAHPYLEVLDMMQRTGRPLVRRHGGVWGIADSDQDLEQRALREREWHVGGAVTTLLENRQYIERMYRDTRSWADPRKLTEAGTALANESPTIVRMRQRKFTLKGLRPRGADGEDARLERAELKQCDREPVAGSIFRSEQAYLEARFNIKPPVKGNDNDKP